MLRTLAWIFLAGWFAVAGAAQAEEIQIERVAIEMGDDGFVLEADFEFEINARLEEALKNGLSLYFLIELEINRSRWYWFDERVVQRAQRVRLWYHSLTRQYRLSAGAFSQSFATLDEAQRTLTRLRGWTFAERGTLRPDTIYMCFLRMRLDTSQLPRPLQGSLAGNRDWNLSSAWHRWTYQPVVPAR